MPGQVTIALTPALPQYYVGQEIRATFTVKTVAGVLDDPGDLTFLRTDPAGVTTAEPMIDLEAETTGLFHYDFIVDSAGSWMLRASIAGDADLKAATETSVKVLPSAIQPIPEEP
jgi:hypothetical protein